MFDGCAVTSGGQKNLVNFVVSLAFVAFSTSSARGDVKLSCTFTKYNNSGYEISQAKSWIPEEQNHIIQDDGVAKHALYGLKGTVRKDNEKKVEFQYEDEHKGLPVTWKYIYFRTTKKATVSVDFKNFKDISNVWGSCSESAVNGDDWINPQKANDKEICEKVFLIMPGFSAEITKTSPEGTVVSDLWIEEAKRRWGVSYSKDKKSYCHRIVVGTDKIQSEPVSGESSSSKKLESAKASCSELGFVLGTEKHGDCVLKLIDY